MLPFKMMIVTPTVSWRLSISVLSKNRKGLRAGNLLMEPMLNRRYAAMLYKLEDV